MRRMKRVTFYVELYPAVFKDEGNLEYTVEED